MSSMYHTSESSVINLGSNKKQCNIYEDCKFFHHRFSTWSSSKPVLWSWGLAKLRSSHSPITISAVVKISQSPTTWPDTVDPSDRPSTMWRWPAAPDRVPTREQISKCSSNVWILLFPSAGVWLANLMVALVRDPQQVRMNGARRFCSAT